MLDREVKELKELVKRNPRTKELSERELTKRIVQMDDVSFVNYSLKLYTL